MRNAGEHTGQRADNVREDAGTAGPAAYPPGEPAPYAAGQTAAGTAGETAAGTAGEAAGEMWAAGYPAGARRTDTWVLVCGGIAAAAAFAAAFVAAGGVAGAAGQHAVPGSTVPAVVSQACPSAAP
jgi:hypothetical protein